MASNYEGDVSQYSPQISWGIVFSGKDHYTEEEFLGFEDPSSSEHEGKEKSKSKKKTQKESNLRFTRSRAHGQSFFAAAWRSRDQKCF